LKWDKVPSADKIADKAAQGNKMARQIHYNAAEHVPEKTAQDPYLRPAFSGPERLRRLVWNLCWLFFYRPSPRPFHSWRAMLLKSFGAKLGPHCHFYPGSRIWAPWNLDCAEQVTAGDGAEIYNPAPMRFGSHAIVSQQAYICGATHDYDNPAFPLIAYSMEIGAYAWICARASVGPGVNIGQGAVLGLASVTTRDLEPWGVYAGVPAVKVKQRKRIIENAESGFSAS
jgi:putative colanic acid biosynthesis acetyltransferase WcaF